MIVLMIVVVVGMLLTLFVVGGELSEETDTPTQIPQTTTPTDLTTPAAPTIPTTTTTETEGTVPPP
jgi:hypothetical protein